MDGKVSLNLRGGQGLYSACYFDQDGLRSMQAITFPSCASSNVSGAEDSGGKALCGKFNLL